MKQIIMSLKHFTNAKQGDGIFHYKGILRSSKSSKRSLASHANQQWSSEEGPIWLPSQANCWAVVGTLVTMDLLSTPGAVSRLVWLEYLLVTITAIPHSHRGRGLTHSLWRRQPAGHLAWLSGSSEERFSVAFEKAIVKSCPRPTPQKKGVFTSTKEC
jgi:hypothetical protein